MTRAREAVDVLLALIAATQVRVAAWRDLVEAVSSVDSPSPLHHLGEFLESVISRTGLDVRWVTTGPPPTTELQGRRSWEDVVRYGEELLREPHEETARVVYTTVSSAVSGLTIERYGPLTFLGAVWLRGVLADPKSHYVRELPHELTTDDFLHKVELRILPDDTPNDMVVARIELGPGPRDTAPSEARRLLGSVLAIAALHTRPGTWVVGDQYEYGLGWGYWDRAPGPSVYVPQYVAEDLDALRNDGRLAALVQDAKVDGTISRAATRLAATHSSVDADMKLAESVRTLELVFHGSGMRWPAAARDQIALVWGARTVANWMCRIVQHAARELASRSKPEDRDPSVTLLISDRLEMRSEILEHSAVLRGATRPLQPITRLSLDEVFEWMDDPKSLSSAAVQEAEAFRRRMRRVERLRNGVAHVGRPPERVLDSTAESAHGFATYACLMALHATARGMTLQNHLDQERVQGDRFHRSLERGDVMGAASVV